MVMGKNAAGNEVAGKMNDTTAAGVVNVNVKVQYATTDVQDSYVECQVGSLIGDDTIFPDALPTMVKTPSLEIYAYTYTAATENLNGRTIQGFSTQLEDKLKLGPNAPYEHFEYFRNYYGES